MQLSDVLLNYYICGMVQKSGIAILVLLVIFFSCRKEKMFTDSSAKLNFSTDSILFDTVFTTIGSSTKYLIVKNPYKQPVTISSIRLAKGNNSQFRLNIDGISANKVENIEIKERDSIFILIEVTVDPLNSNSPLVVTDSILFETNGNLQDVDLIAWGQDAHYILADTYISLFPPFKRIPCNTVWKNDKPYVIYGFAFVDSTCKLIIEAGTKVHFHQNSGLWIYQGGSLIVNGEKDKEVYFQGDRLESDYKDTPGQWNRIWIMDEGATSKINYAIIKNAYVGIQTEPWLFSAADSASNVVEISNTKILNMANTGLLARNYNIKCSNVLIANCGANSLSISGSGFYEFSHCTFANYWTYETRSTELLFISNKDIYDPYKLFPIKNIWKANFTNCIIYGSNSNELYIDNHSEGIIGYTFDHCVIKTTISTSDQLRYIDILKNPAMAIVDGQTHDPVFNAPADNDYHLFSTSVAIDKGNTSTSGQNDIEGTVRGSFPDLGVYEFTP